MVNLCTGLYKKLTHPSVYSACSNPRYASHLLPITFPHVKQRIGIIIAVMLKKNWNIKKAELYHLALLTGDHNMDCIKYNYSRIHIFVNFVLNYVYF